MRNPSLEASHKYWQLGGLSSRLLLLSLLLFSFQWAQAQDSRTAQSGNWNNAATWQGGVIPTGVNEVYINTGHTVTLVANTVTSNVVSVDGILQLAGFNFTAGSLIGGGTGSVRSASGTPVFTVGSDNSSRTFSGTLGTGAFSLVKVGSGTLSLSLANTFTGNTSVNAGAIRITNGTALGTAGTVTVASGAALQVEGGIEFTRPLILNGAGLSSDGALVNNTGDNTISSTITLGSASTIQSDAGNLLLTGATAITGSTFALTFSGSGNSSVSGIITGSGLFAKNGTGTLSLSASNTFTGNKTINAGILSAESALALGSSGSITVANGAALSLAGSITLARPVTINGTGPSSNGALRNGTGDNFLSGTLTLGSASRIESNDGTLTLSAATAVNGSGQNLTVGGTATVSITGVLGTVAGSLTKEESGTLILTAINTFTGGTNISGGNLNIRNASALGSSGAITVANGATLQLENNINFGRPTTITGTGVGGGGAIRSISGTNTISATITLAAAARVNSDDGTLTLSATPAVTSTNQNLSIGGAGSITASSTFTIGSGQLNKDGNGLLTMSVANTYTGNTNISGGTLLPTNMNALGTSGTVNITGSGTLQLQGVVTFARPINLASAGNGNIGGIRSVSGNNTLSGSITMTGNGRINSDLNTLSLTGAGSLSGTSQLLTLGGAGNITFNRAITTTTGGLTKDGSGTATLNIPCTFTGTTTVSAGTLVYGTNNIIGSGDLTITGGTLNIGAFSDTVNLFSVNGGVVTGTGTIYSIQDYSFSGTATIGIILGGSAGLLKVGGGVTTLTGANTFTGQVWIQNGTLSVSSMNNVVGGSASSNLGAPTTALNGMIRFGIGSSDGTLLYTGAGQTSDRMYELAGGNGGNGTIENDGSGALVLTGNVVSDAVGTSTFFLRGTNTGNNIFSGEIEENVGTGTTALSKQDAGLWILTRSNSFGGNVTIGNGTLRLEADGALGQGSTLTITGTSALELAPSVGNMSLQHDMTITGNGVGNFGVIQNINGNNRLNGVVSLSGTTTIYSNQDTLSFLGTPSIRSNNDATGRTLTLRGVGHMVIQNDWNHGTSATLNKRDAGTLVMNGQRISVGTFNVFTGLVIMGGHDRLNNGTLLDNDAVVDLNGFNLRVQRLQGNSTGRFQTNVAATCTLTVENTTTSLPTYSGQINDGSGTLWTRFEGTGGQVLNTTGSNYTGGTYIEGLVRVVALTNSGTNSSIGRGSSSPTIVINNGTLEYNSTGARSTNRAIQLDGPGTLNQINSGIITYNGNITSTNQNLVLQANSGRTGQINSVISLGTGTLSKENAGIWVLAGSNTYSGNTNITAGELRIGNAGAIPTNSLVVNNSLLNLNGFDIEVSGISGTDTTAEIRSNIAGSASITLNSASGDITYSGRILNGTGTVSVVKNGAYTQRVGGNNSYTGTTTINAGVFKAVSATAISSASAFTIGNTAGATLDIQGFNNSIGSLAGGGVAGGDVLLGTATLSIGSNNSSTTYAGTITGVGTGGIEKVGTGVFTFSGTIDYTGLTIISGGDFRAGSDLEFPGVISINTGAQFDCNAFQSSCFYLSFNALRQVSGSWGSTASAAFNKNNTYFVGSTGILVAIDGIANGYWLGTTSTDWFTTTNWHNGHIPQDTTRAVIEYVAINAPSINGTATCNNIEIFPDATVTMVASSIIDVHGDWLNYGSFVPATSTVNFRKASGVAQVITRPSVGPFANLQYFGTGTLRLSSNEPRPFEMTGALLTNTGNTIDLNGKGLICAGLGGPGLITNSQPFDVIIAISGTTDRTFSGIIQNGSGTVGLSKAGSMTQILDGNNTFSGGITVSAGTLHARDAAAAMGAGNVTLSGTNPVLRLSNTAGVGLNFARPIIVDANAEIISDNNTAGAGATHTLGSLSLNTSLLSISGGANVNSGIAGINFGAVTHSLATTYTVTNPVGGGLTQLSLGALTGGAFPVVMNGNGNIVQSGAFTIQPALATESAITYNGTGTLTLSQNNTMTQRLTLSSGMTIATANGNALGSATTVYMSGGYLTLQNNTPLAFNNAVTATVNPTFFSDRTTAGDGVTHTLGNYNALTGVDSMRVMVGANVSSGIAGVAFGTLIHPATTNINVDTLALMQTAGFAGSSRTINKYGGGEFSITGNSTRTATTNLYAGDLRLGSENSLGTSITGVLNFYGGRLVLAADANTTFNNTDVLLRATTQPILVDRATPGTTSVTHTINELVWNANNLELEVLRGTNISGAGQGILGINLLNQNTSGRTYNYRTGADARIEWPNYAPSSANIVVNHRGAGTLAQASGASLTTLLTTTINQLGSGNLEFSGTNNLQGAVNIDSGELRYATNTQTFRSLNLNSPGQINPQSELGYALSFFIGGVRQAPRLYGSQASTAQFRNDTLFTPGSTGRFGLKGYLEFITQPIGGRSSLLFASPPVVQLRDSLGVLLDNPDNTAPIFAFLSVTDATNRGRLRGDSVELMVNDRATFDSLRIGGRADSVYRIAFIVDSLVTPALESDNISVTPGPIEPSLSSVVFSVDTAIANGVDSVFVTVVLSDIDTNFITNQLVSLTQDSGKVSTIVAQNFGFSNSFGVAQFAVSSTVADSIDYFAVTQLGSDDPFQGTARVYFIPGPPFRLLVNNPPYSTQVNNIFFPPIEVSIYDSNDNRMWTDTNTVTLSLLPVGVINGNSIATEVSGVAAFPIVSISNGGTYFMRAAVGSIADTSLAFDIIENYYRGGKGDGFDANLPRVTNLDGKFVLQLDGSFVARDKLYDGTTNIISGGITNNSISLVGLDPAFTNVTLDTVAYSFLSPAVGENKRVVISQADITGADTSEYLFSFFGAPFGTAKILGQGYFGGDGRGDVRAQSDTVFLDGVKAVPSKVVFDSPPGDQIANETFSLSARILSADNRLVPFGAEQAILDYYTNPSGAILTGGTESFTGGVAVFNNLAVDREGTGYELSLEPGGSITHPLDTAVSPPFDVYVVYDGGQGRGDSSLGLISRGLDGVAYDVWIGGASGNVNNWFTAANWNTGLAPRDTSRLLIPLRPNQPSLNRSAVPAENSFTLASAGKLILTNGSVLTIDSGTAGADGPLFLLANGSETETRGPNSKIIVEPFARYVNLSSSQPRLESRQRLSGVKGWRQLGSPVKTTYADFLDSLETQGYPGSKFDSLQPNVLWFAETDTGTTLQSWRQPSNASDSTVQGRGHFIYVFDGAGYPARVSGGGNYADTLPVVLTSTGFEPDLTTGDFVFPELTFTPRALSTQADTAGGNTFFLDENVADAGWNLLANPTPSVLNWDATSGAWTANNLDNTFYIWDPSFGSTGGYRYWNGSIGNINDTTYENGYIAPYQAFWVHANAASPSLSFNNDAKIDTSARFYSRQQAPPSISFTLEGDGMRANSFVSFSQQGITGPDVYDAYQLESYNDSWLMLYSQSSTRHKKPLVINHLPDNLSNEIAIPLQLAAARDRQPISGNYTIFWNLTENWPAEWTVALMDHHNEKVVPMQAQNSYAFSYTAPASPAFRTAQEEGDFRSPKAVLHGSRPDIGENPVLRQQREPQRPFTIVIIPNHDGSDIVYRPDHPYLYPPMPNPFEQECTLAFYLPVESLASIEVSDMFGKVVSKQPQELYTAGTHELVWNAPQAKAGTYVVRLITADFVSTQKAVKIK